MTLPHRIRDALRRAGRSPKEFNNDPQRIANWFRGWRAVGERLKR